MEVDDGKLNIVDNTYNRDTWLRSTESVYKHKNDCMSVCLSIMLDDVSFMVAKINFIRIQLE